MNERTNHLVEVREAVEGMRGKSLRVHTKGKFHRVSKALKVIKKEVSLQTSEKKRTCIAFQDKNANNNRNNLNNNNSNNNNG